MGKCNHCGVSVKGGSVCPLCGRLVEISEEERMYPACGSDAQETDGRRLPYWQILITFAAVGICAGVNLMTRGSTGGYWCLDIVAVFAYLWMLVLHTVKSAARGSLKLFLQACLVNAMLCVFDWNAGGSRWSIQFAVPIACIGFILLATYIVTTRKVSWNEYIGYMIVVAVLGQVPVFSVIFGFAHFEWIGFAAAGYSVVTILVMLMFAYTRYKNERTRRLRF